MSNEKTPEGSKPTRKSQDEDERLRDEAAAESGGDAPIDPADEGLIESHQKK